MATKRQQQLQNYTRGRTFSTITSNIGAGIGGALNGYYNAQEMQLKNKMFGLEQEKLKASIEKERLRAEQPFGGDLMSQMLAIGAVGKLDPTVQRDVLGSLGFKAASEPVDKAPDTSGAVPPTTYEITGVTKSGPTVGQSASSKIQQNLYELGESEKVKQVSDVAGGQMKSKVTSGFNLDLVSGSLLPLSQTLAGAYAEGGAGNVLKKGLTSLAQSGWLPEGQQEKFSESTAISGKRTEVLLKMMPLMSSQYGKEGSTRVLQGVFDKLGESIPDLENAPLNAIRMIENTVDTLYGVVRAVENVNLENYDVDDPEQSKKLIDRIVVLAKNLEIKGDEKAAVDQLKATVVAPIAAYREAKRRGLI